jgi:pimeloyl-ACP methyl ester carboxylesterase
MGALIAMEYAGRHAEAVATLTLIGPAGLGRPVLPPDRLLRNDLVAGVVARRFGRRILESHLGHNVRDPGRAADLAAIVRDAFRYEGSRHAVFDTLQHVRLSRRADLYRRTAALGIPIQLLWGADDRVIPVEHLKEARALLDPLECHVVDECGHMVPFERPVVVADRVTSFVGLHVERHES